MHGKPRAHLQPGFVLLAPGLLDISFENVIISSSNSLLVRDVYFLLSIILLLV